MTNNKETISKTISTTEKITFIQMQCTIKRFHLTLGHTKDNSMKSHRLHLSMERDSQSWLKDYRICSVNKLEFRLNTKRNLVASHLHYKWALPFFNNKTFKFSKRHLKSSKSSKPNTFPSQFPFNKCHLLLTLFLTEETLNKSKNKFKIQLFRMKWALRLKVWCNLENAEVEREKEMICILWKLKIESLS